MIKGSNLINNERDIYLKNVYIGLQQKKRSMSPTIYLPALLLILDVVLLPNSVLWILHLAFSAPF